MNPNEIDQGKCDVSFDSNALYAKFFQCSHILHRRVGRRASRQRVLKMLLENGTLTQSEVRRRLGIQAGSFSELAAKMEKKGLIVCEKDTNDRRRVVLRLTEHGKKVATEPNEIGDEELFHALTDEEKNELRGMLQKIIDAHIAWKRGNELQ